MKKSDLWAMDEDDEEADQENQKRRDEFIKKPKNLELKQSKQEEQQSKDQFARNVYNKNAQESKQRQQQFEAKPQRTKTRHTNNNRNEAKPASDSQQPSQQENKRGGQSAGEEIDESAQGGEQTSKPKTYEEVKRDRRWKNDNKAKVVHHNRKELAAKKMSRGFF